VCGHSLRAALSEFARTLAGGGDTLSVHVTNVRPPDIADADVVVVVAGVGAGGLESTVRQALAAWSRSAVLEGKVAFGVLVGDGPADFGRQYDAMTDALSRCGATAFAPPLALVRGQQDNGLLMEKYCGHWAPVMPALRQMAAVRAKKTVVA
jgi:hypothetical protein